MSTSDPFPEYESHDALGLAEQVENGQVSPEELLDAALDRVRRRNPELNSVVIPMEAEARAAIEAGNTAKAYQLRRELLTKYLGLAADQELRKTVLEIGLREAGA